MEEHRFLKPTVGLIVAMLWFVPGNWAAWAEETNDLPKDVAQSIRELKRMTLDELMEQPVTMATKTSSPLWEVPAAIHVIRGEEIERSGAMRLPQALRLAPNLEVAQVNSHSWAISARGFNNTLANKLLVMIDGRTIYTPLYGGVFWDAQHVLMEDIDHIEVVSGPGGTLWGANAINGIINIATKSSRETQGLYVSGAAGSLLQDFGAVRYGGRGGSNLYYRVYGQRYDWNPTELPGGRNGSDRWDMTQGGFRTDWYPAADDTLTVQGDYYDGTLDGEEADTQLDGQNILSRWTHHVTPDSSWQVQMYFDRTWRETPRTFAERLLTYDLDLQHQFPILQRQHIVWGLGYRVMRDEVSNSETLAFLPADRTLQVFSGFLQDEIDLVADHLRFIIGSKVEHNDYSEWEFQPSARLAWTPDRRQTIWAAVSQAVRTPSRIDRDYYTPPPPVDPGTPNLAGGPGFHSEKLLAYELGYRVRPKEAISLSLATYYHFYEDLRSVDERTPDNFILANNYNGEVWGIELSTRYRATDWWRIRGSYNYLDKDLWPDDETGVNASVREGNDPEHQFKIQSLLDLPYNFTFDLSGRYVDVLSSPHVPSYVTFDSRLAWRFKSLELSVVGQNLLESEHREFGARRIPRSVYGKVTWKY